MVLAEFDLDEVASFRAQWALFRDRRPDTYAILCTQDGQQQQHRRCV